MPSFTVTLCDKSENPGNRGHAFKVATLSITSCLLISFILLTFQIFNREDQSGRSYILAAEDDKEMKTWMNVLSLASIAFGSGKASMARPSKTPQQLADEHDAELALMQKRAAERAGGISATTSKTLLHDDRVNHVVLMTQILLCPAKSARLFEVLSASLPRVLCRASSSSLTAKPCSCSQNRPRQDRPSSIKVSYRYACRPE
jgi:hypothetical protein